MAHEPALGRAQAIAREHGHTRASFVHLALALLEEDVVRAHLASIGYSLRRLEGHFREELANEAPASAYRDTPDVGVDPALEALLAPTSTMLGFSKRPATNAIVFERLLEHWKERTQFRFEEGALRRFTEATKEVARRLGHGTQVIEHVFIALAKRTADDGRFARALETLGHTPDDVARALTRRFSDPRARSTVGISGFPALRVRLSILANASRREDLAIAPLVVDFLRHPHARAALEAVGVSPSALLFTYVHGSSRAEPVAVKGPVEVVLHNDDFSTMEVVMKVLQEHFDRSQEEATTITMQVHAYGSTTFSVADGAGADAAVRAARAECDALGMPLRMELRGLPVGDAPPATKKS